MKIIFAKNSGFCFGVKRAIDMTEEALNDNKINNIYSLGPLIHNSQVVNKYEEQGLKVLDNIDEIKNGNVIIRAHGVPLKIYETLQDNKNNIIDCTCPHVKLVHKKVNDYKDNGFDIIIVGDKNHPEVIGINGWCNNEALIVNSVDEAKKLQELGKIFVVSQTEKKNLIV